MTNDARSLHISRKDSRLVNDVVERLHRMIAEGDLVPGQRLREVELSERLGVSRTPIREALLRLESDGTIVVDPGRGRYIRTLSNDEVRHVYEVRLALEPMAASRGCEHADERHLAEVAAFQLRHDRSDGVDPAQFVDFHRLLAAPCGNGILLDFLNILWTHEDNARLFAARVSDPVDVGEIVAEHRAIAAAYGARDVAQVEQLMREHVSCRPPI